MHCLFLTTLPCPATGLGLPQGLRQSQKQPVSKLRKLAYACRLWSARMRCSPCSFSCPHPSSQSKRRTFGLVGWSGGRFCSLLNRFSLSSLEKATILAWSENFAVPRVRGWKIFCSSSSTKNSGLICVRIECPSPVASNESAGPSGADLALRVKNELCGQ